MHGSGWCSHVATTQIPLTPGKPCEHCEGNFFSFPVPSGQYNHCCLGEATCLPTDHSIWYLMTVSNVVGCSTGAQQGMVLSPFLCTLYTSDFRYNTAVTSRCSLMIQPSLDADQKVRPQSSSHKQQQDFSRNMPQTTWIGYWDGGDHANTWVFT